MQRFPVFCFWLGASLTLIVGARGAVDFPVANPTETNQAFVGVWLGRITAPNAETEFGIAFTPTEKGLLVSLYMPEMFIYNVNFGPAEIRDGVFQLPPLDLVLSRSGESLVGTFAKPKLPVSLHRASAFAPEPATAEYPAGPPPLWTRPLGAAAWASPVAFGAGVYVGTVDGRFHALWANDGSAAWTWNGVVPLYGEALVTEDLVCFVDSKSELVALSRVDGSFRWRVPLHDEKIAGRPVPQNETFTHRTAVPVIDNRNVIYVGSTDGGLYAIRSRDGKILWRHDAGAPIYSAVAVDGEQLVAGTFDGSLFALNRRTQKESFHVKLGGPIVSTPTIADGKLLVGARDYLLYGVKLADGRTAWRDSYWFSWVESTPRIVDGVAYIGGSDFRRVSAINPADGRRRWATDVQGLCWGTPVVTSTTVYVATAGQHTAGTVITHTGSIVALDRASGAVKWRYAAPIPAGATMSGFAGSLSLAGDRIIGAGLDGNLIAFATGEPPAAAPSDGKSSR
jgi:outer membrane protein assembly factor BamB